MEVSTEEVAKGDFLIFLRSCDVLGLPYTSDFASIKSKYREMAKKYHPDINKAPDATERFQKINDAYGFLNEANVNKYKNLG